jgi:hypothetical protein
MLLLELELCPGVYPGEVGSMDDDELREVRWRLK